MKTKSNNGQSRLWVAVKVERGYVEEAKIFESLNAAKQIERRWRERLNPDYDETAVVEAQVIPCRTRKPRRRC